MWNAVLDESQAGIKTAGRNINNLRYADDTTLIAESEEKLKSLLMSAKEQSENADLKLNIQETKIVAFSPVTSWQIGGEKVETVTDFLFLGSKITVDSDCSREIKRWLLLGRKAMTNLNRDITLPTKMLCQSKLWFSSSHIWMWELDRIESWVPKNRCFLIVVLEKTLESSWTAWRSNQSILKEINPDYSLEGLMLKLKLLYLGHPMQTADSLEKALMAGKDWWQKEKGEAEVEMIR